MSEPFDPYAEDPALRKYAEAQAAEWGEWVAIGDIYVGNALAARRGDAIPKSNVEKHGYDKDGLVVKRNSKEGREITGEPEPVKPVGDQGAKPVKSAGGNG
jgi:hypothetical protein